MLDCEIKSPQPIRPLKRKASQLDALETPLCKNSYVDLWLSRSLPSINRGRSRSDSFLIFKDPERQALRQNGPEPARPLSKPINARSLQPESVRYSPAQSPSTVYDPYQSQDTFYTPSTSSTPASYSYESNMSSPDSKNGPNRSKRVQSSTYRNALESHGVYVDSYGITTPDTVQTHATNIISRKRSSPGLSGQQIESTRKQLSDLASTDEGITRAGFTGTSLFPTRTDYGGRVAVGSGLRFDRAGLPFTSGFNYPPIVTPVPDLHYGYPRSSFQHPEYATMQHSRLKPYSEPNTANFWPFFAVEFKSLSRGGTCWVAENQNAGTGSHCVNSMEILMNYARGQKQRRITDTVFFSCVVDTSAASIWVHWMDLHDDPRFSSSEIDHFSLKKPKDLVAFRASVRNIIDYGIDQRLTIIKDALNDLLPQVAQWDQEDEESTLQNRDDGGAVE